MIITPRTGETWLSRSTGEPVTITDSYATAIIGARVAHADAAGHRQNDGLASFHARYVPAVTRPHPLDRAIDGAIKTDLGLGVRTDQPFVPLAGNTSTRRPSCWTRSSAASATSWSSSRS